MDIHTQREALMRIVLFMIQHVLTHLMVASKTCTVVQGPLKETLSKTNRTALVNSLVLPIICESFVIIICESIDGEKFTIMQIGDN